MNLELKEIILLKIVEIRKNRGLSLENMANDLNIGIAAYHKIEKSETKLSLDRFLEILDVLQIPIMQFLSDIVLDYSPVNFINSDILNSKMITENYIESLKQEISFLRNKNLLLVNKIIEN